MAGILGQRMGYSLALVAPNREISISSALSRWQFPNHVFKVRARLVCRGRVVDRLRPAFPRYIFLDPLGAWDALRQRFGVVNFVRDGENIATVPDLALNSLLRTADHNGVLPSPQFQSSRFHPGDRVIVQNIEDVRIANQRAIFCAMLDERLALVHLDWLSASVPAHVDERQLVLESDVTTTKVIPRRKRRRRRRGSRQRENPT